MSPPCDRFQREALPDLEAGRPLDPHFETCPDCRAARKAHLKLASALADVGARHTPRGDWEAGVWGAIARERPPRRGVIGWLAALAALAALAVGVFTLFPRGDGPLPGYGVSVSAGESPVRAGEPGGETPVVGPGSALTVVLQPEAPVEGQVSARAWASHADGLRPLALAPQVAGPGGIRVRVSGDDPALAPGPALLVFAVGRPSALPAADAAQAALTAGRRGGPGWLLLTQPVTVRAP